MNPLQGILVATNRNHCLDIPIVELQQKMMDVEPERISSAALQYLVIVRRELRLGPCGASRTGRRMCVVHGANAL